MSLIVPVGFMAGPLYGMWFDGTNNTVLMDGTPFDSKTKGRITATFQTASSAYQNFVSLTDNSDINSDVSVALVFSRLFFNIREAGTQIIRGSTAATFADGLAHDFDIEVTASGNTIKVDGVLQSVTYTDGNASTVAWAANVNNVDVLSVGVRQESIPDAFVTGVVRDLVIYDEDGTSALASWVGDGPDDANWTDQIGSNDGTVAGSPSRAVSYDGGATWAEE